MNPVQIIDLRSEAIVLDRRAWNASTRRDPKTQRGICLHQWGTKVGTTSSNRIKYGEPEALARRALKVPAHISVGVTERTNVPIVALAHPLDRYLYGSDAANAHFLTMEVMGLFPYEESTRSTHHSRMTPELQAAVSMGLKVALDMLDDWTGSQGPWELITHRQGCNSKGDHTSCCGEGPLSLALHALDEEGIAGRLVPDPDLTLNAKWSKPWPPSWRQHLAPPPKEKAESEDLFNC